MPAPTAPLVTSTISFPAFRWAATCATSCSNCAGSICFRLSVSTPVPSLTTRRAAVFRESRCTCKVKMKSAREKRRKWRLIFLRQQQRTEKITAPQGDQHFQARQIGQGLHILDDDIFDADGLPAIVPPVFQVDELRLADGDIQNINACEIVAGSLFEIHRAFAAGFFYRQTNAQGENIRLPGLVFNDAASTE